MRRLAIALSALILLVTACPPAGAATRQLRSYESLRAALLSGEPAASPAAIGVVAIEACERFAAGSIGNEQEYLAFSHTTLINRREFVHNDVKFRVCADGKGGGAAAFFIPR